MPAQCASKPFLAHVERARRRCLTQMPSNMVRDSILPPHLSMMLSPDRQDPNVYVHERRLTPTKEMILELLANSPNGNPSLTSDSLSKPAFAKFNQLPNLVTEPHTSQMPNQLAELVENNPPPNSSSASTLPGKNPAKRRVRATYGVRLESIRLDPDVDITSTRKCRSYDEYLPSHKEGVRLTPLVHAGKL